MKATFCSLALPLRHLKVLLSFSTLVLWDLLRGKSAALSAVLVHSLLDLTSTSVREPQLFPGSPICIVDAGVHELPSHPNSLNGSPDTIFSHCKITRDDHKEFPKDGICHLSTPAEFLASRSRLRSYQSRG